MTDPGGYYDASYPPELWDAPAAPVAAGRPVGAGAPAVTLEVAAGAPGTYAPELKAAERPTSLTELRERATPADAAPWSAGQFVPIGERGKRAHWDGTDWATGVAPTVPAGTVERPAEERSSRSQA